jgi:feruloyl esterase
MMRKRLVLSIFLGIIGLATTPAFAAQSCEDLKSLKLPDTTINAATVVPAGDFTPPGPAAPNARPIQVPSFCRVQLTIMPAIQVEVWMPVSGWNKNFEGVGNGGYAGSIQYGPLGEAIRSGYAAASTDTGHVGGDGKFALGHPELVVDFGYRAIHEMTDKGKKVVDAFYGAPPQLSYFNGCSNGGRQGLMEAERYPGDYKGILAGAPAINWDHMVASWLWTNLSTAKDEESYIPQKKLAAIVKASVAACDLTDGVQDGLVGDPRLCKFDPSVLLCNGADADTCLTQKQVDALEKLYAGPKYPDGKPVYPPYMPGTEGGWGVFTTGAAVNRGLLANFGNAYMRYFVLNDPDWDFRSSDLAMDVAKIDADEKDHSTLDALNPDLRPFRKNGGKLIVYHGWGDNVVSTLDSINYYKMVVAALTGVGKGSDAYTPEDAKWIKASTKVGSFYRVFLIPGMNHCAGGPGPTNLKGMDALAAWVEKKQAPDQIMGTHMTNGAADLTRPLCPYPMAAQYSGQGSVTDAANFACKLPSANSNHASKSKDHGNNGF